jgi:hypothetical protein
MKGEQTMANNVATENKGQEIELVMAEAPVAFTDGDYFRGMCEIAAAAHTKQALYIPAKTRGIFDSLFHKRIFARKELENGSWAVGNFQVTENRYLYNFDPITRTYRDKKEDNYNSFLTLVKEISEKKNYTVFSLTAPVKENNQLDAILK